MFNMGDQSIVGIIEENIASIYLIVCIIPSVSLNLNWGRAAVGELQFVFTRHWVTSTKVSKKCWDRTQCMHDEWGIWSHGHVKEKVSKWCRKKLKLLLLKSLIEENLFYVKLQIQANWANVKSELFCAKLNDWYLQICMHFNVSLTTFCRLCCCFCWSASWDRLAESLSAKPPAFIPTRIAHRSF